MPTSTTHITTPPLHDALPISTKDPVCGMDVVPSRSAGKHQHDGKTYYFCAVSCLKKFQQHPEAYLSKHQGPPPAAARSEEHTSDLQSQSNLVCRLLRE